LDGDRASDRHHDRTGRVAVRPSLSHVVFRLSGAAALRDRPARQRPLLRYRRLRARDRRRHADADRARAPVRPWPSCRSGVGRGAADAAPEAGARVGRRGLMEGIVALAIGVLTGSGVWLLLRPRTFQVILGLSLISYAVFCLKKKTRALRTGAAPIPCPGTAGSLAAESP